MSNWLRMLEYEISNPNITECSRYETRKSQLVELLRLGVIPLCDRFTARLMVGQLSRWLGSFVGCENPDEYRPVYPLAEIDEFVDRYLDEVKR